MARNDLFLLDGILDRYITEGIPSQKPDEVFEYFATEQILKDYAFSSDQLLTVLLMGVMMEGSTSFLF